jgi:glycosyltransferase A (GT-A) superfamily protein (DUF2064 family)
MTTVAVVAKQCIPGKVKTRLCPPLTPQHAARVAAAALDDTLDAVRRACAGGGEPLLYLDGDEAPASAAGFGVLPQCDGPFDVRLAHLFDVCEGPTVLVGMDTPHLDPDLLARLTTAWPDDVDAWFGAATDGGFWLLGLREPTGAYVRGVPMSLDTTGARVRRRLDAAGLVTRDVPPLVDVDTIDDALAVAALAPGTRFAREVSGSLVALGIDPAHAGAAGRVP